MEKGLKLWEAIKAVENGDEVQWRVNGEDEWDEFSLEAIDGADHIFLRQAEYRMAREKTEAEKFLEKWKGEKIRWTAWTEKEFIEPTATHGPDKFIGIASNEMIQGPHYVATIAGYEWVEWHPPQPVPLTAEDYHGEPIRYPQDSLAGVVVTCWNGVGVFFRDGGIQKYSKSWRTLAENWEYYKDGKWQPMSKGGEA